MSLTHQEEQYMLRHADRVVADMGVSTISSTFIWYANPDVYELRFLTADVALSKTRLHAVRITEEHLWDLRQAARDSYFQLMYTNSTAPDPLDEYLRPFLSRLFIAERLQLIYGRPA